MARFDREGALKTAEKALRQGRIDAAIAEYVRIVEAQPRDWNSANALGDLYVRASQIDKGVAQYTRIADHLFEEGFYPKAAALFKKILKIRPDHEHSLMQSAEIAAKQGLLADAKTFYKTVAERRRAKGDKRGAAEIHVKIGLLDPDDLESRLGAARAAVDMGETLTALREYKEVGLKYEKQGNKAEALAAYQAAYELSPQDASLRARLLKGYLDAGDITRARSIATTIDDLKQLAAALEAAGRHDDVLEVLAAVAEQDPNDLGVRAGLAQAYVGKGDLDRARAYLTPETAGINPALWLTLAELELSSGRIEEGRRAIAKTLELDPSRKAALVELGCRLAEKSPEAGYPCIDAVADLELSSNDYAAAAAALHEFVTRVRHHIIALMRLVDVCVDGGLEATMYEAQAQLADAYLEVGRGLEARIISEDLVAREPWNRANIERFRRALVTLGESDPDSIIAERLSGESPFLATDKLDLNEGQSFDEPAQEESAASHPHDAAASSVVQAAGAGPARALEPDRSISDDAAAEQYRLALTYHELGMTDEAIAALEVAARSSRQRFDACALLGRLFVESSDTARAIEWWERAAEAAAPTPDAGRSLLYDLAAALESAGEPARALAVFVELESESGGYRDVARRIERLSKVQARG